MITFQEQEDRNARAEKAILAHTNEEISPSDLIEKLSRQGIDSYSIRAGIWMLIDEDKLCYNDARKLVAV